MPEQIEKALVEFYASEFWRAVVAGYNADPSSFNLNAPDAAMLKNLEQSIYQFSMAKSYAQLKAISQALLDEAGQLRSFSQFRLAAAAINNEFVNQWLQAEYNYAVAASRSASQWQTIQETKAILPLLQYRTVGDERVRADHQELEDITRPADDDFWNTYYPPNGWNCRCDVYQLSSGTITDLSNRSLPDIPALFQYNPGKQGIVFPAGHPYYEGLPEKHKTAAEALWQANTLSKK